MTKPERPTTSVVAPRGARPGTSVSVARARRALRLPPRVVARRLLEEATRESRRIAMQRARGGAGPLDLSPHRPGRRERGARADADTPAPSSARGTAAIAHARTDPRHGALVAERAARAARRELELFGDAPVTAHAAAAVARGRPLGARLAGRPSTAAWTSPTRAARATSSCRGSSRACAISSRSPRASRCRATRPRSPSSRTTSSTGCARTRSAARSTGPWRWRSRSARST